ncbi:MAG: hypothetical protein QOC77_95 [Thermoleophilaceae bacterium]|jgi:hypothetical protein|nr:hypothetical protein [Thermoleophilaceae bacterium]
MPSSLLRVIEGVTAGRQIAMDEDFVVGRGESGMGNLGGDTEISRQHARFRRLDGGQVMVEDLNSTNGTLVNGQRITGPHVLSPGDRITLGRTTLQFEGDPQPAAAAAAPVAPAAARVAPAPAAAAPATPVTAAPAALGPLPGNIGRGPEGAKEGGRARGTLALAGVLLLAVGIGIGLLVNKDSGGSSSSTTAASTSTPTTTAPNAGSGPSGSTGAPLSPQGLPDPSGFACVGDKNGTPGPGHFRFITSGCENATSTIAQFPLQKGTSGGKTVWYVVTDSSSKADALARHVNYAPKLANAIGTPGVQTVKETNGVIDFPATVNFSPKREIQPGPGGFPPAKASPPSVGNAGYSPLIKLPSGIVINAPQIANDSGQADKAIKLDMAKGTVLYQETEGRYEDKHVHYASFESGNPIAATIEDVTYAPAFNTIPKAGDVGMKTSARERLIAFINGPTGIANPGRQGINSTILDSADPHNILQEVPVLPQHPDVGALLYTPGWDVHFAEWTPEATNSGARVEIQSGDELDLRVQMKLVTGPGGKKFGPSNFTVNCPLISIDIP